MSFHKNLLSKSLLLVESAEINREMALSLKDLYPRPLIKGFYKINKSNVLFKKLKNRRTQRSDDFYIGEVIEVNKKNHLGIHLKGRELNFGDEIKLFTPDGKEKTHKISRMTNSSLEPITESSKGEIVFISHLGGVSIKTQVYFNKG